MKEICRNCHFLAKEHRDNTGRALSFSFSPRDRDDFKGGKFDAVADHYSLKCHFGVWDEGIDLDTGKRDELINRTSRKNQCFYHPYTPGMLFNAAEVLQKRKEQNRQIKRAHFLTFVGLMIASLGLIVNAVFALLNYLKH